jgi:23S rRNA (uracil1939-C5)-methyltransferase
VRRTFWRGRAVEILVASRDRVCGPGESCPGCDWGHFEPAAAREAKRALFLETMQRIGKLPVPAFGELPIVASPPGYRIRNRFHLEGRGADLSLGQFAARSHRVESVAGCRAITPATATMLPSIRDALASTGAALSELATLEDTDASKRLARAILADGGRRQLKAEADAVAGALSFFFAGVKVVGPDGAILREFGDARLPITTNGRTFLVSADSFFQGNRHLGPVLMSDVSAATSGPTVETLDAFGGVGFFAAALLDAGHSVVSVEGSASAARDAAKTRLLWSDADRWKIVPSSVAGFLSSSARSFERVVVDPPRAGLGAVALPIGERARRQLVYVSCDPATLARDLAQLSADGFEIADTRLYDLFALTHRVEAVVTLVRGLRRTA